MGPKPFIAILLFVSLALAGCSGNKDDDDGPGTISRSGTTTTASGNITVSNDPPNAELSVVVNGTEAVFTLGGSDPDNDTLSWSLDFGDGQAENGTTLPANVTHTYAAGEFTANLTVSDGTLNATKQVPVTVAAGGATGLGQAASMAWDIGLTDEESVTQGPSYLTCEDGPNKTFNYDSFVLDPATIGQPFKATISDASGGTAIQSWTLYFNLADCSDYAETFSVDGAGEITGVVPDDAGPFALAMATGGFLLEVEYTSGSQIV